MAVRVVRIALSLVAAIALAGIGGCVEIATATAGPKGFALFQPRLNGTLDNMERASPAQLRQFQLVSTDLVSALMQMSEFDPASVTLQVSAPVSPFGNTLVRALEDAGYGLQWVSADQGSRYVSYSERFSRTDTGSVTDFEINVGPIRIRREYNIADDSVLPSSKMYVSGISKQQKIDLNEEMFREQAVGGKIFVSGVIDPQTHVVITEADDVVVSDFDRLPANKQMSSAHVLELTRQLIARRRFADSAPELSGYGKLRRTVLLFQDNQSGLLGTGNKQVVSLLVRRFNGDDLFVISPCGPREGALAHGMRIKREFLSFGIPQQAVVVASCASAAYRSSSDDALIAVTVVHHRRRGNL